MRRLLGPHDAYAHSQGLLSSCQVVLRPAAGAPVHVHVCEDFVGLVLEAY